MEPRLAFALLNKSARGPQPESGNLLLFPPPPPAQATVTELIDLVDGVLAKNSAVLRQPFKVEVGVCRICGCTEDDPCRLSSGDPCQWYNKLRTICSNPNCVQKAGFTPAAVIRGRR